MVPALSSTSAWGPTMLTRGDGAPKPLVASPQAGCHFMGNRRRSWEPFKLARRSNPLQPRAGLGFGPKKQEQPKEDKSCPCSSGKSYEKCCKVFHDGAVPETPEQLMRARYSAYAKGDNNPALVDFIVNSTHPDNPLRPGAPDSTLRADVVSTCDKISWERLKVLSTEDGAGPEEAFVTFQTFFRTRRQRGVRDKKMIVQTFVERSRFLRENGKWLYVDGEQDWDPK